MKSILSILFGLSMLSLVAGCGEDQASVEEIPTVADEEAVFIIGGEVPEDTDAGGKYR